MNTENPLNPPTSESIEKGELSLRKLSDSGATFRFWSDNPEVHIDVGLIGYASEIKSEQKVGKQNELLLTVPKAIVETWLGMKLYAQCKATLGEKQYTSPKTLFTVVP